MLDPQKFLAPHFKLCEFLHGDDPLPPAWVVNNLTRLAHRLQGIRDLLGLPVLINSGYRTAEHNRAVGGVKNSFHLKGMAADIIIPGMPAAEVQRHLRNWQGGMGSYAHFTHVDIRPYRARWTQLLSPESSEPQ
jgi:uncharacterized protein YcbK (DUF882 family)